MITGQIVGRQECSGSSNKEKVVFSKKLTIISIHKFLWSRMVDN